MRYGVPWAATTASPLPRPTTPARACPTPFAQLDQLTGLFAGMGFTADELITHSVGRAHCASFSERIRPNLSDTMGALDVLTGDHDSSVLPFPTAGSSSSVLQSE
ncbi:hypothetical protein EJB05_30947, partial [Eragrostis curvula]